MAIIVPYTSTIDRYLIIPKLLARFIIYISVLAGIVMLLEYGINLEALHLSAVFNVIIFVMLIIGGSLLSNYIFNKIAGEFFYTLSSYLYVKYKLKTKMSWKDANYVAFLFVPNVSGKWYTMSEVLKIDEEQRSFYIKRFAEKVLLENTVVPNK